MLSLLGMVKVIDVYGDGNKFPVSVQYLDLNGKGILKEYVVVEGGHKKYIETGKLSQPELERIADELKNA